MGNGFILECVPACPATPIPLDIAHRREWRFVSWPGITPTLAPRETSLGCVFLPRNALGILQRVDLRGSGINKWDGPTAWGNGMS